MAEIYVTSTADSGSGSLRQAIADAQDGDVILFDADVFPVGATTAILLSSYITVNKSVGIYGGESDGEGGYTSGTTKRYYVYRDIEGVKTKVYIDDNNPAQEGETVLFDLVCRVALDGQEAVRCLYANTNNNSVCMLCGVAFVNGVNAQAGGGVYTANASKNVLTDCLIENCASSANGGGVYTRGTSSTVLNTCVITDCVCGDTYSGGGVYSHDASKNTLNGCIITGCNATSGGGVYSTSTSQNTLNGCIITGCNATTSGGGVYSISTSQNTLNGCIITGCSSATGGGARLTGFSNSVFVQCVFKDNTATSWGQSVYATSESVSLFDKCIFISNDFRSNDTPQITSDATSFDSLALNNNATFNVVGGITTIAAATLNAATITIADGAALTLTGTATIGAATFTSDGRGYLAVASGIDTSAATLTNVVLCAYGADVSSFAEVDGVLEWEAANPTTTVLIERADGDSWTTVTQTAGESLTLYLPPSDTVRLFDGDQFFTAQAPSQRTYYYIGGAEGSFTSAADWSLRRGGAAITEPPVVAGQRFIIGDIEDAQEE